MIGFLDRLARPLLRALDPEDAHSFAVKGLKLAPRFPRKADDSRLAVRAFGLNFPNPVGLAPGFDKHAEVPNALLHLGFGFVEIGTVTPLPQPGNPRPRLFRLEPDQAVINRFGFNSDGEAAVLARLAARAEQGGIVGVNVGANKEAAENTRTAFDKALTYPIDGIETDIQLTRDEVAVLWHDRFLNKLGHPTKHIDDFDHAELRTMNFAAHFSSDTKPEGIMSLKEFIGAYRKRCRLLIEIKNRDWESILRHEIKVRKTLELAGAAKGDEKAALLSNAKVLADKVKAADAKRAEVEDRKSVV